MIFIISIIQKILLRRSDQGKWDGGM